MREESLYSCNICGNNSFKLRSDLSERLAGNLDKFNVVKCRRCGLHSLFPLPDNNELKKIYNNYITEGGRVEVEKKRMKEIYPNKIAHIKKKLPKCKSILDIGAGIGGFVTTAKMNGYNVVGVEFDEEQCRHAKHLFKINLIHDSFENFYSYNKMSYDVINLHHVLEHMTDPKNILDKVRTILNKNGLLLVEVPNQFFKMERELKIFLGKITPTQPYNPYHHLYFFSPYTLQILLNICNYEILELNELPKKQKRVRSYLNQFIAHALKMGISSRIEIIAKY